MAKKDNKLTSLNTIPNTIFFVVLIVGFGAIFGLWGYEIFEKDKQLPFLNKMQENNLNISDKSEYFENDLIQIESPTQNTTIKDPVLISGKADVFEANVRVRIKDENKNILADDFITASGWMGELYPFEKEISYNPPTSQNGIIEVFEENVKNGNEINKVIIPVVFENYDQ